MMDQKYALVAVPPESKETRIIETEKIYNFDKYNFTTRSKVYRYQGDNGNKVKCAIIKVGATVEGLIYISSRLPRPKITNQSSLGSSDEENESAIAKAKKYRKGKKKNSNSAKKRRIDDIVNKFNASEGTVEKIANKNRRNNYISSNDESESEKEKEKEEKDKEEEDEEEENEENDERYDNCLKDDYLTGESDIFDGEKDEQVRGEQTDHTAKENEIEMNAFKRIIPESDKEDDIPRNLDKDLIEEDLDETYDDEFERANDLENYPERETENITKRPNFDPFFSATTVTKLPAVNSMGRLPQIQPGSSRVIQSTNVKKREITSTAKPTNASRRIQLRSNNGTSEKTQSGAYLNLVEQCKQQELEIKKWKQRALLAEAAYQAQLNKRDRPSH
ncbi:myb-like protein X [Cotesia glomerata]|uniref:myb-like protein X n=1 Tax=Cotesia glomerata TaxID=32391 RepID=UPI001D00F910|nr:myb-like protein X [Cotesia glomerata]